MPNLEQCNQLAKTRKPRKLVGTTNKPMREFQGLYRFLAFKDNHVHAIFENGAILTTSTVVNTNKRPITTNRSILTVNTRNSEYVFC